MNLTEKTYIENEVSKILIESIDLSIRHQNKFLFSSPHC